ncbi:SH3 domain-containing protein [Occallatibacter savannae]|uniref:SH3 domain-containing protein n=1 Tax=Occallatibacter savannae TaxID=1002691 RepID=UPI0013A5856B|nr:SH3 domain-containing protein [Occallatibacter savannae]
MSRLKSRVALRFVLLGTTLAGSLAGAQQSVPNAEFVVSRPVVNMYKSASADTEVTSQVLYGTGVKSLEKQGDWIRIETADDYTGWVEAGDVRAQGGSAYAPEGHSVRVTALSANAYREADVTEHAPVLRLPWEAILEVASDSPKDDARWLRFGWWMGKLHGCSAAM